MGYLILSALDVNTVEKVLSCSALTNPILSGARSVKHQAGYGNELSMINNKLKTETLNELIPELTVIIARGLLEYTRILQHDPKTEYIPPTENDVIWKYQNIPIFNRIVSRIICQIQKVL